jgi:hypothetical protein
VMTKPRMVKRVSVSMILRSLRWCGFYPCQCSFIPKVQLAVCRIR